MTRLTTFLALATLLIAWPVNAQEETVELEAGNLAETVELEAGTFVPAVLTENINTNFQAAGGTIYFLVTEDVAVHDKILIRKGAIVKARLSNVSGRGMVGKGAGANLQFSNVIAVDGTAVRLFKENINLSGAGMSTRGIIGLGLFAKGGAAYVFRGIEYDLTVALDTDINYDENMPVEEEPQARLQTSAEFEGIRKKIRFGRIKSGDDIKLTISLTPELASLVQEIPSTVEIVESNGIKLVTPSNPIRVEKGFDTLTATFDFWSAIKYAQPGLRNQMTIRLQLSDGSYAEAVAHLSVEWNLK